MKFNRMHPGLLNKLLFTMILSLFIMCENGVETPQITYIDYSSPVYTIAGPDDMEFEKNNPDHISCCSYVSKKLSNEESDFANTSIQKAVTRQNMESSSGIIGFPVFFDDIAVIIHSEDNLCYHLRIISSLETE